MAGNYVQDGDRISLVAPYARNAGEGALVGSIFGVALNNLLISASGEFAVEGVWDLTALSTATGAQGAKVYWDDANKRCDTASTVGILIGALTTAKTNGQTTMRVKLNEAVPEELRGTLAAIPSLTGTLTGAVDDVMENVAATAAATAGGATPTAAQVDTGIATAVASIVTGVNLQNTDMQAKINAILTALRTAGIIAP